LSDTITTIGLSNAQLMQHQASLDWIWDGVIACGGVTLLSAPEKTGKTTLLSLLLDRRREGGELLGGAVLPGKTILCSEESPRLWALRQPPLDFGPYLIHHKPGSLNPSRETWEIFFNELCDAESEPYRFDLLVIDTAIHFLPILGRDRTVMRWVFATLKRLALGCAVVLINQSRTMHRSLAAFADIVMELSIPRGCLAGTRRRILTGVGRFPGTLQFAEGELNEEGTDYVPVGGAGRSRPTMRSIVQAMLANSAAPLTHEQIIQQWPGPPPREDSLWRVLAQAQQEGILTVEGAGTKADPLRFGLT
jgi:hypothetical protein